MNMGCQFVSYAIVFDVLPKFCHVMKIAAAIYSILHAKLRESRPAREYNGFCLENEIKIN